MSNTGKRARKLAVVAVGGNALIGEKGRDTYADQYLCVQATMHHVIALICQGWDVVVTHGNGPQVGFILRQSELAAHEVAPLPLDCCGAMTQGAIGSMFVLALNNEFRHLHMPNQALALVTQTLVSRDDPAFLHPSKPIGAFMDAAAARRHQDEDGWTVAEDAGRGWRRVVASPHPVKILQQGAILSLVQQGFSVVSSGGGGIPVVEDAQGNLAGVEAVIDKDLASALLAAAINADLFLIATAVEQVAVNFNTPTVRWLDHLSVTEARRYAAEGHFGKGSMEPKIGAVVQYLERGGKQALITNPENMVRALAGETGTHFTA